MAFNLLPSKWTNKRNNIAVQRSDEQEHPVYSLQREMNRIFDDFFRTADFPVMGGPSDLFPFDTFGRTAPGPRIDVQETDKELRISAELPGMTDKDIDLSLTKDRLTISGEKRQETEQNVKGWHCKERNYGAFKRVIPLPCEVDEDRCTASFKNGVLTVSLSKAPQAQATLKSIPIKKE